MPDQDSDINPWLIAISVMLATFMEVIDTSIASVALPHIAGSLSATTDEATWVLTAVYDRKPEDVAGAIEMLLNHRELVVQEPTVIAEALAHVVRTHL